MASPDSPLTAAESPTLPPRAGSDPALHGAAHIDPAHRHAMIAEAAFFMALARSFTPCQELDDWLAAEREIEQRLSNPAH